MSETRYMISDASKQVNVEAHVLRYWEEELALDIPRNEMGHRYYTEEHIRMFKQIKGYTPTAFREMYSTALPGSKYYGGV